MCTMAWYTQTALGSPCPSGYQRERVGRWRTQVHEVGVPRASDQARVKIRVGLQRIGAQMTPSTQSTAAITIHGAGAPIVRSANLLEVSEVSNACIQKCIPGVVQQKGKLPLEVLCMLWYHTREFNRQIPCGVCGRARCFPLWTRESICISTQTWCCSTLSLFAF